MLVKFLSSCEIERGKVIARHPEANYYKRDRGELRQFKLDLAYDGFRRIPSSAQVIVFPYVDKNMFTREYGLPVFLSSRVLGDRVVNLEYDSNGEIKSCKQ